jgi:hypothetical protein
MGEVEGEVGFTRLRGICDEAAKELIPERKPPPKLSGTVQKLLPIIRALESKGDITDEDLRKLQSKAKHSVSDAASLLVDRYVDHLCFRRDPWNAWQHVFAAKKRPLALKSNKITMQRLRDEQFTPLLQPEPPPLPELRLPQVKPWQVTDLDAVLQWNDKPFTTDELKIAAASMKCHKAHGPDDFPVEFFKCQEVLEALCPVFNLILDSPDSCPRELHRAFLVGLHKKGCLDDPANYRGISLMSCVTKLLHKVFLLRLRPTLDPHISASQNAYRPSRGCQQHIVAAAARVCLECFPQPRSSPSGNRFILLVSHRSV